MRKRLRRPQQNKPLTSSPPLWISSPPPPASSVSPPLPAPSSSPPSSSSAPPAQLRPPAASASSSRTPRSLRHRGGVSAPPACALPPDGQRRPGRRPRGSARCHDWVTHQKHRSEHRSSVSKTAIRLTHRLMLAIPYKLNISSYNKKICLLQTIRRRKIQNTNKNLCRVTTHFRFNYKKHFCSVIVIVQLLCRPPQAILIFYTSLSN